MSNENIGYTDYPEADIATHRSVARTTFVLSVVIFAVGTYGYVTGIPDSYWLLGLAGAGSLSSVRMQRTAQRWEDALNEGETHE